MVDASVATDGSVSEACVVDLQPDGYGIHDVALRSVKGGRWPRATEGSPGFERTVRVVIEWPLYGRSPIRRP